MADTDNANSGKQRRHHHDDLEWNRQKSNIERIYIQQNKPLDVLMAVMKTKFDFEAG
jgi:Clr5 domain